jgi:hypothetical protein
LTVSDEWKDLSYTFEVRGTEQVELVCEFRSAVGGMGEFDAGSMRLIRKKSEKPEREVPVQAP